RMKSGRPHEVPLSPQAIAVLERMAVAREDGFIFPGRDGSLKESAMRMLMQEAGFGSYTVHGLRSSFRDWCGERTGFDRDVAEAALGHVTANATEAAYRRGSFLAKRRRLREAGGGFGASRTERGGSEGVAMGHRR